MLPEIKKDAPRGARVFQPLDDSEKNLQAIKLQCFMEKLDDLESQRLSSMPGMQDPARVSNMYTLLAYDGSLALSLWVKPQHIPY